MFVYFDPWVYSYVLIGSHHFHHSSQTLVLRCFRLCDNYTGEGYSTNNSRRLTGVYLHIYQQLSLSYRHLPALIGYYRYIPPALNVSRKLPNVVHNTKSNYRARLQCKSIETCLALQWVPFFSFVRNHSNCCKWFCLQKGTAVLILKGFLRPLLSGHVVLVWASTWKLRKPVPTLPDISAKDTYCPRNRKNY